MTIARKQDLGYKLTMRSSIRQLAIKIYEEQMPDGWDKVQELIKDVDKSKYQIIAIKHDRDPDTNDIWEPTMEKPHFHIIVRVLGKSPTKVSTVLNLIGIKFRPTLDNILWKNQGVDTIKNFADYALYLTHETQKAILDGKTKYELNECVSNLSLDEIERVREGYTRVSGLIEKVDTTMMADVAESAKQTGYDLKDFTDWYASLPFEIAAHSKMKTVKEWYNIGVSQRIEEDDMVIRVCVYIHGAPNMGKTIAARNALKGQKILFVGAGGTGKFDKLSPATNAIIIDDNTCPNLEHMSDNIMCQVYKRNSNNPYWCGEYFIVTGNAPFDTWMENCNVSEESRDAVRSRFYICHIEEKEGADALVCDAVSRRGDNEVQAIRLEKFQTFYEKYNDSLREYSKRKHSESAAKVDYDVIRYHSWTDEGFIQLPPDEKDPFENTVFEQEELQL